MPTCSRRTTKGPVGVQLPATLRLMLQWVRGNYTLPRPAIRLTTFDLASPRLTEAVVVIIKIRKA